MIVTVIGGGSSKKSEYAESIVMKLKKQAPVYLATMICTGSEDEKIIKRHRKLRQGKGFITVEKPVRLYETQLPECDTLLFEDVSNLVANEFFSYGDIVPGEKAFSEIKKGIDHLVANVENLVIVTGNVFEDGCIYDEVTEEYMNTFGDVNRYIAGISDVFVEMVYGNPVFYKGQADL